jgi:tetratricopeptide (TPR) repeat protein
VYFRRGDYETAIRHYELALRTAPANPLPIVRNLRQAETARDRSHTAVEPAPPGSPAPAPATPPTP